jgi:hypothetical protein
MTQPVPNPSPSADSVNKFHTNSDADSATTALHHTLGIGASQASPGPHTHNGQNSKKIGKGINVAFPTTANAAYSQAQMQNVIDALRALGLGI